MKLLIKLIWLFIYVITIEGQVAKIQSNPVKLNIKYPPPDIVTPTIDFQLPIVYQGFPIYSKDSVYLLSGQLTDNSNKIKVKVNDRDLGFYSLGPIALNVSLIPGENKTSFSFEDKSNNILKKEITFYFDPLADIIAPAITLSPPFSDLTRGIQVVSKDSFDSLAAISGTVSDQSDILGVWINNNKVDSIYNKSFYYQFQGKIPDSVKIVVVDVFGNMSTFSAIMEEPPEMLTGTDLGEINYHALIITIGKYQDPSFNDLDGPIKDGQNLTKVLNEYYNFNKNNIKILKNATRSQIIKAFDEYKRKLDEDDNLLIFYAGHGKYDEDTETGYWLPSDANSDNSANWLPNSAIRDYLRGIKTQHTLLISDACFASSILRDPFPGAEKSIIEIYKNKSRKAIISGSDEAPDKSVFVEYLIHYLKKIDKQYFPAELLYSKIKDPVINNSKTGQIPEYKSIPFTGDEGLSGDFIFTRTVKHTEKK